MKIKTSELTGAALCYAVCMMEMPHLVWGETIGIHHASNQIVVPELPEPLCYSPFMGWAQGGQIIEREFICADYIHRGRWLAVKRNSDDAYSDAGEMIAGPTPLIAAMRCYVSSRCGDIVEVPDELL